MALGFAYCELRNDNDKDRKILLVAIKQNKKAYDLLLSEGLKNDPEVKAAAGIF